MKKGMVMQRMVSMILILACFLIIVVFLAKIKDVSINFSEDSQCQASILAHTTLLKISGEASVSDIVCPTKYYAVNSNTDEEINRALAESMRVCWSTWGKGELQLFKQDDYYCHVCSVVDFNDKGKTSNNFVSYLANTKITGNSGKGQTYAEYFKFYSSGEPDDFVKNLPALDQSMTINTDNRYASIFLYAKGDNFEKLFYETIGPDQFGAAGGGVMVFGTLGLLGAGVINIWNPLGWGILTAATVIAASTLTGTIFGAYHGWAVANNIEHTSVVILRPYDAKSLIDLKCKETFASQDMQKQRLN